MALLLGKGVEGVSDTVMEEVGECIMHWMGSGNRKGRICRMESKWTDFSPLPALLICIMHLIG